MSLSMGTYQSQAPPSAGGAEVRAYIDERFHVLVTKPGGGGGRRQQCRTPDEAEQIALEEARAVARSHGPVVLVVEKRSLVADPGEAPGGGSGLT